MKFIPVFLISLLLLDCSDRERSNPLDPRNPDTHGAPTGFQVVANRDTAQLSWDPVLVDSLERYLLHRSTGTDPPSLYHRVGPDSTMFNEYNLKYDSTYIYALEAKTTMGLSRRTEPDTLIPGPHNFLINDKSHSTIWNISFDGRHVLERKYFDWPDALIHHPVSGRVWIASSAFWDKAIYYMSCRFTQVERFPLDGRPIDLAAETTSKNVYVLQILPDTIHCVNALGNATRSISVPPNIDADATIAYDETGNLLWLYNPSSWSAGALYSRNPYSTDVDWEPIATVEYSYRLIADPMQGGCWIATYDGLYYFAPDGGHNKYLEDTAIWDISINPGYGDCYFVARGPEETHWSVGTFFLREGPVDALYLDIMLPSPVIIQAMAANRKAGFLLGSTEAGEILRYDADGRLMSKMDGFGYYLEFALD